MSKLAELKKASKQSISSMVEQAERMTGAKKDYSDDRFWKPTRDKSGNGYAEIRFLPSPDATEGGLPWVRFWDHGFKGPTGRWYIEKSRTSLKEEDGKEDPLAERNSALWAAGKKDEARKYKRRCHYVANVLIIKDPANPENDGKVKLFKFGQKIFKMITDAMSPEFEDETPINPFDPWTGANFKIKIRQVEGWPNYDKSGFDDPSEIGDDSKIEEILEELSDLQEFIDPKNYKSYDELKKKLDLAMGTKTHDKDEQEEVADYTPPTNEAKAPEAGRVDEAEEPSSEDDDDDISFFEKYVKNED